MEKDLERQALVDHSLSLESRTIGVVMNRHSLNRESAKKRDTKMEATIPNLMGTHRTTLGSKAVGQFALICLS